MDPALEELHKPTGRTVTRRAFIERPRGHSKTTDIATTVLWLLLHTEHKHGILAAADKEQAQLIVQAMQRVARANDFDGLIWARNKVSSTTGTTVEVMAADAATSWGILPDFVVCDEVCHWTNFDFWCSLYSSAGKKESCILVCLSNAGVGRGWQWELRESARKSEDWYFHSLDGPTAPWITERMLDEQRAMLPAPVFARLWLNQWQASDGEFITLAEAEACRDDALTPQAQGVHGTRYVAVIDYAEKHDLTAACIAHLNPFTGRVVVDRIDVVAPTPATPTPVAWVEAWIDATARNFRDVQFIVDEWQLLQLVQTHSTQHLIERFPFRSGQSNQAICQHLREAILNRRIAWFPDAGKLEHDDGTRDDLETEIAALQLHQTPAGYFRFDHRQDGKHHDDRAFVVAVASMHLVNRDNSPNFAYLTPPTPEGAFAPFRL